MELRDFTNLEQWATQQWGQAKLGDSRHQARAIALGAKLAAHPGQSLPQQLESWGKRPIVCSTSAMSPIKP
jgi:Transposase DNA-binding